MIEELRKGRATPQRQGSTQGGRRLLAALLVQLGAGLSGEPLELQRVNIFLGDTQQISRSLGDQRRPDRLAQPRDVMAQRIDRVSGHAVAPEPLDQPIH
jgi:hypothetical protein